VSQALLSLPTQFELMLAIRAVSAFTVENDRFVGQDLSVTGHRPNAAMTIDSVVTLRAGERGWYAASRDERQKVGECRPQGDKPTSRLRAQQIPSGPIAARDWDG
jgi:hypothetical protein